MTHHPTLRPLAAIGAAALLVTCMPAFAQSASDQAGQAAQRQQQLEEQRQREQFQRDREGAAPNTRLPRPAVPAPSTKGGACRDIAQVEIQGVSLLRPDRVEQIASRYRQRCLAVGDIEGLLSDLTRAYVEAGWIMARAYLPAQDLGTGTLRVVVVEGRVAGVEIDDGDRRSISLPNVAPFVVGRALNIRDFEQALDQVNRLASNRATLEMKPGSTTGDTVVVLRNQPTAPVHGSLSTDNQGSASTGRVQTAATLSLDNPLGLNDFVSFTHRESPDSDPGRGSESNTLSYVLPLGYATVSANLARSSFTSQVVTGAGTVLHNAGDSGTQTLRLDRVLYRDATTRFGGYANLTRKSNRSYLEDALLQASSRRLAVLDLGVTASTVVAGGALSLDLSVSRGLRALGALQDAADVASSDPRAQFRKWTLGGSYSHGLQLGERKLDWSAQWSAQFSEQVLYGSEQMLVGGLYSVRGFTDSTLSGDHGAYLRNEIGTRMPFGEGAMRGSWRPWIAVDIGVSRSRKAGEQEGTLVGAALGVQFALPEDISVDVFATAPVAKPSFLKRESPALWLRATKGM